MTLSEFKAWFEGFTEGFGGAAPTEAQFAKIKAKVALIDGTPVTYPVFVDRWWPRGNWWDNPIMASPARPTWWSANNVTSQASASSEGTVFAGYSDGVHRGPLISEGYAYIDPATKGDNQTVTFDSHAAMRDLGRMEAAA